MHDKNKETNPAVLLKYQKPFDFNRILSFMKPRAMTGIEAVTENSYSRTFRIEKAKGYFIVTDNPEKSVLELKIDCDNKKYNMEICSRVRKMFDLDTDFSRINKKFAKDKLLSKGIKDGHVPRLPAAFDPFEFTIRAILGQQITVKAATTLASRIAERAGLKTNNVFPTGLDYFFPNLPELLKLDIDGIGITKTRQATIKTVIKALDNKDFSLTPDQTFENFHKDFSALKGIGDWTVNYVAMRGLGMVDRFPASDLGIIKAFIENDKGDDKKPSKKEITDMAEKWRPYRTYAALCLWNSGNSKK